jgi:hypothetical protein
MDIKLDSVLVLAIFTFFFIAIFLGTFWVIKTEKRIKRFFLGKKAKDLEENLSLLEEEMAKFKRKQAEMENEIKTVNQKLRKSLRGLETIRFNPFPDQGSNQSFAIGILNEEGDGVVLSSLYSRERMSVFAKPIKGGKSEYELTLEEKEALKKAEV